MTIQEYTESVIPALRRLFPFEAQYNSSIELERKEAELFQFVKGMTLTDTIQKLESIKFNTNTGYYPKADMLVIDEGKKGIQYDYIQHFQKMRDLYHPKATQEFLVWLKDRMQDNDHSAQFDGKLWDAPWMWNQPLTGEDYALSIQGWDKSYNQDPRFNNYVKELMGKAGLI